MKPSVLWFYCELHTLDFFTQKEEAPFDAPSRYCITLSV